MVFLLYFIKFFHIFLTKNNYIYIKNKFENHIYRKYLIIRNLISKIYYLFYFFYKYKLNHQNRVLTKGRMK